MTDKIDGLTMDLEAENKKKLQTAFPECFTEGRLDIDKLLSLCGEYITDDYEKYEFKWKGKSECARYQDRRTSRQLFITSEYPCGYWRADFDKTCYRL